ncbi:MAG: polysaccharide export protein [Lentisphaeria bacterium]|nr:polysaccharide export protein [Lentisphaeria bacterium]
MKMHVSHLDRVRMLLAVLAAALLPAGCYSDRWTGNYDDIQELGIEAIKAERAARANPDAQKQQEAILKKIAAEPLPPYTINGGDKIEVMVYSHPDLSVKTVVTPDGYLGLVLVGQVKVKGLTLAEASAKIEKVLSRYIRNPRVGLSPYEIGSETATITGAVHKAGIYPITDGMRLADLFAKAGGGASRYYDGQTVSAVDYDSSLFLRDQKPVPVDFRRAIEKGDPLHNLKLRSGDYVFVAGRDDSMVYLMGNVKKTIKRVWDERMGLLELLAAGEGLAENHWSHAIIIRNGGGKGNVFKVNLDGIFRGTVPDIRLDPGDVVYIPHDNISEYNVAIKKLFPTAQLINLLLSPFSWVYSLFP